MSKIKAYIPWRNNLNTKMLEEAFEIVNSTKEADVVIAQSSLAPDFDGNFSKVVYVAVEPPLADHRLFCYSHFKDFKFVICHNPKGKNEYPFTQTNEPQFYPCNCNPSCIQMITRIDTRMRNRGIFYAGMVGQYENQPDAYGGINLTKLRRELGEYISNNFPNSKIIGIGWNKQFSKCSNWRIDKQEQIKNANCDFVLALENTMLPNYLYEKIWDGFASDRVTLYLGDPNIHEHIPTNCFIDLRDFFNKNTKEFHFKALKEKIMRMTQGEYDNILHNARRFRQTAKNKHRELEKKCTQFVIDKIKELTPQSL
jgi:hypothetical protein